MKDQIKRFIAGIAPLEYFMFLFFHIRSHNRVVRESENRKKLSIFDYKSLSANIPFGPEERVIDNNLYGQAHHIKKYAQIKSDLKAYLEHGLFWGGMVHPDEHHWHFKKIITFSENRKKAIKHHLSTKQGIAIGPYIHYAQPLLSDIERQNLKTELGKTLLVFPSHSVKYFERSFDISPFLDEIIQVAKQFDSVLISLYYLDALNHEKTKVYLDKGYRIVTSGHKYDLNFIARQRELISLADYTMSNDVGTHVGYCIHMNKPHYIFQQHMKRVGHNKKELNRELNVYNENEMRLAEEEKKRVAEKFKSRFKEITIEQRQIVDEFWGTSSIKSPKELREVIL